MHLSVDQTNGNHLVLNRDLNGKGLYFPAHFVDGFTGQLSSARTCVILLENHASPLKSTMFLSYGWLHLDQKHIRVVLVVSCTPLFEMTIKTQTFSVSKHSQHDFSRLSARTVFVSHRVPTIFELFYSLVKIYTIYTTFTTYFSHSSVFIHWFFTFIK